VIAACLWIYGPTRRQKWQSCFVPSVRWVCRAALLVTVPVPAEAELPAAQMESAIAEALVDAARQGIKGKALTPFLLALVSQLTGEASLRANLALLENNARVAAEIALPRRMTNDRKRMTSSAPAYPLRSVAAKRRHLPTTQEAPGYLPRRLSTYHKLTATGGLSTFVLRSPSPARLGRRLAHRKLHGDSLPRPYLEDDLLLAVGVFWPRPR